MIEPGSELMKVSRSLAFPLPPPAIEPSAGGLFVGEDARGKRVPEGDFFEVNPAQQLDAGLSFGGVRDDFHHKVSLRMGKFIRQEIQHISPCMAL